MLTGFPYFYFPYNSSCDLHTSYKGHGADLDLRGRPTRCLDVTVSPLFVRWRSGAYAVTRYRLCRSGVTQQHGACTMLYTPMLYFIFSCLWCGSMPRSRTVCPHLLGQPGPAHPPVAQFKLQHLKGGAWGGRVEGNIPMNSVQPYAAKLMQPLGVGLSEAPPSPRIPVAAQRNVHMRMQSKSGQA